MIFALFKIFGVINFTIVPSYGCDKTSTTPTLFITPLLLNVYITYHERRFLFALLHFAIRV